MNYKNFKNGIMGLYTTPTTYLHNKPRLKFSKFPSLLKGRLFDHKFHYCIQLFEIHVVIIANQLWYSFN